jgi:hypothetical protein
MPRKKVTKTDKLKPEMEKAEPVPGSEEQIKEPSVEPEQESQLESSVETNSKEEINEDVPVKPLPKRNIPRMHDSHRNDKDAEGCHCYDSSYPKGKLPPPPILRARELEDSEIPKPKTGKDGVDKAMEILDQYYEDVPLRNPRVDHGGED